MIRKMNPIDLYIRFWSAEELRATFVSMLMRKCDNDQLEEPE